MKKIVSIVAVLLVSVLALSACSISLGDLGDISYLSVEDVDVKVGETKEIPYTANGLEGSITFETDSDCITISNGSVTGVKVGTATVNAKLDDMGVEFQVNVTAAE